MSNLLNEVSKVRIKSLKTPIHFPNNSILMQTIVKFGAKYTLKDTKLIEVRERGCCFIPCWAK